MPTNQSECGSNEVRSPVNQLAQGLPLKTELEQFCEEVAASHLQIDLAKLRTAIATAGGSSSQVSGISITDILALVELIGQIILKIIESCPERSSERLRSSIVAPTFWQRIRVKNIAKDFFDAAAQRCRREDSGAVGDCLIQCAGGVAAARVQQILDEVQADDNWLV